MDWLIGPVLMVAGFIFYVCVPLVALWLIARGGRATRIISSIVFAIVIAIMSFATGYNMCRHDLSHRERAQFIRPFNLLMSKFKDLCDKGDAATLSNNIARLAGAPLTDIPSNGSSNVLWRAVNDMTEE